jgi:hypothetical protein
LLLAFNRIKTWVLSSDFLSWCSSRKSKHFKISTQTFVFRNSSFLKRSQSVVITWSTSP